MSTEIRLAPEVAGELLVKLMGTSVDIIEQHYGHLLAPHAARSRDILDESGTDSVAQSP